MWTDLELNFPIKALHMSHIGTQNIKHALKQNF